MDPTNDLLAPTTIRFADVDEAGRRLTLLSNADTETPQLWVFGEGGSPRRLTDHIDKVTLGKFRPGGGAVLYGLDDGGDERQQLHLLDLASGTTRALTDAPHAIHDFGGFSPDGRTVAYTTNAANGVDFDVVVHDLEDGSARCVLRGQGFRSVEGWSPDGRWLAVSSAHASLIGELHLVDRATGSVRPLGGTARHAVYKAVRFLDDGDLLLLTDEGREHVGVARLRRSDGTLHWLLAPEADVETLVLDRTKRRLAVTVNHQGYHALEIHDLDGTSPAFVVPSGGIIGDLKWSPDGTVVYTTYETAASAPRPYRFDLATRDFTSLEGFEVTPVGRAPELVDVASFDGRRVPAFLYTPEAPPPASGRPAVVVVHGGPESQWRPAFHGYIQAFLARGWTVLAPNVRGSTGYGRTYAGLDDRERRMDSVKDLLALSRWLAARPDVDAGRMAVMGQSYGGFMTLSALIEAPELWRCGVEYYGITDFNTLLRDTGAYRRNHRAAEYGDPVDGTEFLAAISPLARADRIRAPLFVAHGLSDPRVAPFESQQLIAALKGRGHPVTSVTIPKEGHGFVKRANRLEAYGGVLRFLEAEL